MYRIIDEAEIKYFTPKVTRVNTNRQITRLPRNNSNRNLAVEAVRTLKSVNKLIDAIFAEKTK